MNRGFFQPKLLIRFDLVAGNQFDMEEYLYFHSEKYGLLRVKTHSDGISRPAVLERFLQEFGPYLAGGIVHDGAYQGHLQQQLGDGGWRWLDLDKHESNELLEECLIVKGCPMPVRDAIFEALELFGGIAFDEDRRQLAKEKRPPLPPQDPAPPFML